MSNSLRVKFLLEQNRLRNLSYPRTTSEESLINQILLGIEAFDSAQSRLEDLIKKFDSLPE